MNTEEIIRMAREACDTDKVDAWHNGFWTLTQEEIERFAALVAAAEREACAKVIDAAKADEEDWDSNDWNQAVEFCAARIRARGQA